MIGSWLSHYEIKSHLGSGRIGDVNQATDSKLGRNVDLKVLPESFAHDTERMARFDRARVLHLIGSRNRWMLSIGMGGCFQSEWVDDFALNWWVACPGIRRCQTSHGKPEELTNPL